MAESEYADYEETEAVSVCVQLQTGAMDEDVTATISLSTQPNSATECEIWLLSAQHLSNALSHCSAVDYESLEVQITFDSMSMEGFTECVDITITDDSITEPEETFSATLEAVSDFVTFGTSSSTIVIHDNDGKSVYLSVVTCVDDLVVFVRGCD